MCVCAVVLSCSADEVPAAAAEVSGVPGGREGAGGSAGAQGRAHASQVQHGADPRSEWVSSAGHSGMMRLNASVNTESQLQTFIFVAYCSSEHQLQLYHCTAGISGVFLRFEGWPAYIVHI